jgi:hypothetical protein
MSYKLDYRDSTLSRGKRFSLLHNIRPALEPIQSSVKRIEEIVSLEVKRSGHEADLLLPHSTEVKNGGIIRLLSHSSSWYSA